MYLFHHFKPIPIILFWSGLGDIKKILGITVHMKFCVSHRFLSITGWRSRVNKLFFIVFWYETIFKVSLLLDWKLTSLSTKYTVNITFPYLFYSNLFAIVNGLYAWKNGTSCLFLILFDWEPLRQEMHKKSLNIKIIPLKIMMGMWNFFLSYNVYYFLFIC